MVGPNITSLFNDIYDSTNRKVFAFLAARCKSIPDAHDLFQDTYTELYAVLKRRGTDRHKKESFVPNHKLLRHSSSHLTIYHLHL